MMDGGMKYTGDLKSTSYLFKKAPKVSVIMSVWNAGDYLLKSVESVLVQTFTDFEFIIIDDGSTDGSAELLKQLSDTDVRIKVVLSKENLGLTRRLNEALSMAEGEYIARMDSDDICMPERLEKQVQFLNENEEIGLLGCNVWIIDEKGVRLRLKQNPKSDCELRWVILLDNPFIHPAIMFRKKLIDRGVKYNETFRRTQDYGLWSEMLENTEGCTLQEPLLNYRVHDKQVTVDKRKDQLQVHGAISKENISCKLKLKFEHQEIQDLVRFAQGKLLKDFRTPARTEAVIINYTLLLDTFREKYCSHLCCDKVVDGAYERIYRSIRKSGNIVLAAKWMIYVVRCDKYFLRYLWSRPFKCRKSCS